ncbi:helix-turn-helix domain-containing protein [Streptomyces cyanogenus]|nr:helix-turn-helix transcriptional regulator [Streptomyces cyanogenus]
MLADLVGRSTDWLAKIETGRRKPPRIDMLGALSRVLQNGSLPHRRIGA